MSGCSRRTFAAALLALSGVPAVAPRARAGDHPPALRFGVTPVILDERVGFLNRWGQWLGRAFGRPVQLVQRTRYQEIVDRLLRGQLHLAWICGYPYVQHRQHLELLAVPCWHGRPLYRSEIIVPVRSKAGELGDLAGTRFAWTDPDSNSGWLYPRDRLRQAGHDPDRFFRRTILTWGHARSVQAVAEGLVDGAAVDSYVRETLLLHSPALAGAVRVIERSPCFGFPPIVAGPALAGAERAVIRAALLRQEEDSSGRALLEDLNLDGFAVEPPALYARIAAMAARVGADGRP